MWWFFFNYFFLFYVCRPAYINYKVTMSPFCDETRFCNLIFELHSGALKRKGEFKKALQLLSADDPRYLRSERRLCASLAADLGQFFFGFVFWGGSWCHVNRGQTHSDRMDFITRSLHP